MAASLLVQGGRVVTTEGSFVGDVLIRDGVVAAVGRLDVSLCPEVRVLDATGCLVLPGVVDPHVQLAHHYGKVLMTDDFASGTRAAAYGGVTTIIDFAVQRQGESPREEFRRRRQDADANVHVDYALHVGITDSRPEVLEEIPELVREGAVSFKCYLTYRRRGRMVDEAGLYEVMRRVAAAGGIVEVHAENETLVEHLTGRLMEQGETDAAHFTQGRPEVAERIAAATAIFLAGETGCPLYVHHVSSAHVAELVAAARARGQVVWGEACPQYLLLDDTVYTRPDGHRFILNPPLRGPEHKELLWRALAGGTLATVGTDHCSYLASQKDENRARFPEVPAGLPGIEIMLPLMYTQGVVAGRLSLERLTEVLSLNPARIFGLYPRKGHLAPGADGDLVVYDPAPVWQLHARDLHMNADWSPYEGTPIAGRVKATVVQGQVVYRDGEFVGRPGWGRFVPGQVPASSGGSRPC